MFVVGASNDQHTQVNLHPHLLSSHTQSALASIPPGVGPDNPLSNGHIPPPPPLDHLSPLHHHGDHLTNTHPMDVRGNTPLQTSADLSPQSHLPSLTHSGEHTPIRGSSPTLSDHTGLSNNNNNIIDGSTSMHQKLLEHQMALNGHHSIHSTPIPSPIHMVNDTLKMQQLLQQQQQQQQQQSFKTEVM